MARELPIFPLPLVLFPGVPQPLHIFEPRYRQLLADCLAGDRRFGIAYVTATEQAEAAAVPNPGDVGCVAYIQSARELPDGRSDILTEGERRFVLLEWCPSDRLYRRARVEEFDDDPVDPAEAGPLASEVRDCFARVLSSFEGPVELPTDPTTLSFRVAGALELEPGAKQALQAERSTTLRLRRLVALLKPLAADAARHAVVRERARRNGRGAGEGGAHPEIERAS